MKCPYCNNEMKAGVVQGGGGVLFWAEKKRMIMRSHDIRLGHALQANTPAQYCEACQKIIIDIPEETTHF